ncbi:MAG TPA: helix-turn-helix domain-containing GNAT family N-acetyltransferase [Gemmatimonadaceae bacterium]|nr:helix-turn-helix domain-containing GNAT family N-acetyltransferase [Gemmatimonadaceae bacterium]
MTDRVATVRRFNRMYTRQIGLLNEAFLGSAYSLGEMRVLYELAHRTRPTATEVGKSLGLDLGYLSRVLRRFEQAGLLTKIPSASDARQSLLELTRKGKKEVAALETRQERETGAMLETLPAEQQRRLVESMRTIAEILGAPLETTPPTIILRPPRPGDMGWVVYRHGVVYSQEYGWNDLSEALAAEIVAKFLKEHEPKRERCWIAERPDGEIVGYVFLVAHSETIAQLRLLLVEASARGTGLGRRLVRECIRFARQVGYKRIRLWTNDPLTAARHIYESEGFQLVEEQPNEKFGPKLVAQTWELVL